MKQVKHFLIMSLLLGLYITVIALLMKSYYVYRNAYQILSRLISHPTIEVQIEVAGEEE